MKKLLALLIALALSMTLFACIDGEVYDSTTENPASADVTDNSGSGTTAAQTEQTTTEEVMTKEPTVFAYDFSKLESTLPTPTPANIPDWKGFNVLNMFMQGGGGNDSDFDESVFSTIADLGFNFVRLPIDYRIWTYGGSWEKYDESALENLDSALRYAFDNDIHVSINFHRGPGYTVAQPAEETNLWTDETAQAAFAKLWGIIAHRYKDVPNEFLSFNLINEPDITDPEVYIGAVMPAINIIREWTPDRMIILDGLNWCSQPFIQAKEIGVALATRGYHPNTISHYQADWMQGADKYPVPEWPMLNIPSYFYGDDKPEMQSDLVIKGNFAEETAVSVRVGTVSQSTQLVMLADGVEVYRHNIVSGAGKGAEDGSGEWKTEIFVEEWGIYQNLFDCDFTGIIPAGTKTLTIKGGKGDWMTFDYVSFAPTSNPDAKRVLETKNKDWDVKFPADVTMTDTGFEAEGAAQDREWLKQSYLQSWIDIRNEGVGVMVGEWGAHNRTPHTATLSWMEDWLSLYKEYGFSWALWNFYGSFGIVNSGRDDVDYEQFNGFDLDRKMSDLLQEYK